MDLVSGLLRPDDFYDHKHAVTYRGMQALHSAGEPIDLTTLAGWLDAEGMLKRAGGRGYLAGLMQATPTAVHAESYAKTVANRALARRAIEAAGKMSAAGYEHPNDPGALLEVVTRITNEVTNSTTDAGKVFGPRELTSEFHEYLEERLSNPEAGGLMTGFPDIDRLVGGMSKGDVVIVGARPSTGKTALAECIAENVLQRGKVVVFASLEMSRTQLLARRAARVAKLPASSLLRGAIPPRSNTQWWESLQGAMAKIADTHEWIIDNPSATTSSLRADISRARMRAGRSPDLVIIDYLQLLKDFAGREDGNGRVEFLSAAVKQMARDFEVPILLLSQLSRASEYRSDKRPKSSDLRGSGAIEQDADVIMGLYRAENDDATRDRTTTLRVLKHRNGPTGETKLTFRPDYVEFVNYRWPQPGDAPPPDDFEADAAA